MNQEVKLTFTGDIMSYPPQNKFCKRGAGYDYSEVFREVRGLLLDCDCCIGNLETPLAAAERGYSSEQYSFNTPDAFARDLKNAGIDLVSTANNHCMDRDIEGLYETLDTLDYVGLAHVGTARSEEERRKPCLFRFAGGRKIGFLAYTYGTNAFAHHRFVPEQESFAVNLFQPEETKEGSVHLLDAPEVIEANEQKIRANDALYRKTVLPRLEQLNADAERCRAAGAEFVILIMHSGGQYNPEPDPYTLHLVEWIRENCRIDAIIGHHPHVVQKFRMDGEVPIAYSLGNFASTPGFNPGSTRNQAAYSILLHLHFGLEESALKIKKITYSITKSVVRADGFSSVVPLHVLYRRASAEERAEIQNDYAEVQRRFTGCAEVPEIAPLFTLWERK